MANDTSKVVLPKSVVTTLLNKAKDTSTIAALSPSVPQKFDDQTYLVFNPTAEAEVVAEGAKKGAYDISTSPIVAKRAKVVTTTRVSDELTWADEDNQPRGPDRRNRPRARLHRVPRREPQGRRSALRLHRAHRWREGRDRHRLPG